MPCSAAGGSQRGLSCLAGFPAKVIDPLGRLGLGEIGLHFLSRLGRQGVQVGLLGAGHRLLAGGPIIRILDGVRLARGLLVLLISACHMLFSLSLVLSQSYARKKAEAFPGRKT